MRAQSAKLYTWATEKAISPKAPLWIALIFSLELVLILPLDAVLMFFCLQTPRKSFLYAAIAAVSSLASAIAGYLLGHFLWDLIGDFVVPNLVSTSFFNKILGNFQVYEGWVAFLGALLPLPLKAISLAAGVFHLDFLPFILYVFSARLLRFSLVAGATALGGEKVKLFVEKHFNSILLILAVKLALGSLVVWFAAF